MSGLLWIAIGLGAAILELALPGVFLIWVAGAAWMTGLASLALGVTSPFVQVPLFSVLSVASVAVAVRRRRSAAGPASPPNDADAIIGARAVAPAAIEGRGRLEIGGTSWEIIAEGPVERGGTVVVTAREGNLLRVARSED